MRKRTIHARGLALLAALTLPLLAALTLPLLAACEETPPCRQACIHTCHLCNDDCDLDDPATQEKLDGCEQNCRQNNISPARLDCILETTSCDELWRC
jgi:hypothetical protein